MCGSHPPVRALPRGQRRQRNAAGAAHPRHIDVVDQELDQEGGARSRGGWTTGDNTAAPRRRRSPGRNARHPDRADEPPNLSGRRGFRPCGDRRTAGAAWGGVAVRDALGAIVRGCAVWARHRCQSCVDMSAGPFGGGGSHAGEGLEGDGVKAAVAFTPSQWASWPAVRFLR
ncbi:hypothetical protein GCM10022233_16320 [Streptomyces shaanxiensis]|uniref:Uncharacterized protein n=1 Tax=Streptomyces shaanxiensis TaxID=653357 RepID=A0ABP7UP57_9ACTN